VGEFTPLKSDLGAFVKSALGARLMTAPGVPGPDFNHEVTLDNSDPGATFSMVHQWFEFGDSSTAYPAGTGTRAVYFDKGGAEVARLGQLGGPAFSAGPAIARTFTQSIDGSPVHVDCPDGFTQHTIIRGPEPTPPTLPELGKIEIRQASDDTVLQTFDDIEATDLAEGANGIGDYSEPQGFTLLTEDGGAVCPGTGELRSIVVRWRFFTNAILFPGTFRIAVDYATVAGYVDVSIPGACAGLSGPLSFRFLDTLGATRDLNASVQIAAAGRPSLTPFPLSAGGVYPTSTGPLWEGVRTNTFVETGAAPTWEPATLIRVLSGGVAFSTSLAPYALKHRAP